MRSRMLVFLPICALALAGCSSPGPVLKEPGDTMTITLRSGARFEAELLSVQWTDSAFLCITREAPVQYSRGKDLPVVLLISKSAVDVTTVGGYRNQKWVTGVLATNVGPAVGLALAAGMYGISPFPVLAGSLIPAALSTIFFGITGLPTPAYKGPITDEGLQEMRRYARFAGEFTPAQIEDLLKSYHQTEIVRVH
jgi:hypothetical protein